MKINLFFLLSSLLYHGVCGVDTNKRSVMEGDSVALLTDVKVTQKHRMKWFFNDSRIAEIIGVQSKICTDVQCKERFRDRLKLDNHTGSLTIMNTRNTDAGEYKLQIIFNGSSSFKIFSVEVTGVPAAQQDELKTVSVKEGDPVTLHPGAMKNPNNVLTWHFNDTLIIAEITEDQSKICTDVQCDERFRDRLKVNQTGSLTIMNTRTTDSGEYKLKINTKRRRRSVSISNGKSFMVSVIGVSDPGLSPGAVAGIVVGVLLLVVAAVGAGGVFYLHRRSHTAVPQNEDDCL